jgi:hypothetical protein
MEAAGLESYSLVEAVNHFSPIIVLLSSIVIAVVQMALLSLCVSSMISRPSLSVRGH